VGQSSDTVGVTSGKDELVGCASGPGEPTAPRERSHLALQERAPIVGVTRAPAGWAARPAFYRAIHLTALALGTGAAVCRGYP
jgi:hypothetical protein